MWRCDSFLTDFLRRGLILPGLQMGRGIGSMVARLSAFSSPCWLDGKCYQKGRLVQKPQVPPWTRPPDGPTCGLGSIRSHRLSADEWKIPELHVAPGVGFKGFSDDNRLALNSWISSSTGWFSWYNIPTPELSTPVFGLSFLNSCLDFSKHSPNMPKQLL